MKFVVLALAAALVAGCSAKVVRDPSASASTAAATPASAGRPGATTVVQRGDTLFAIASRNGVAVGDLARWNGIQPPYTIYPGQRLRLFPGGAAAATAGRPASPATSAPGATRPPASASRPATAEPARPAAPPAAPLNSGIAWRWPADGTMLSRFVAGDPTKQGIDIGGAGGAPVRAAGDGTVVYSGSGLVGYGELVIVKHSDAWLSAYGHNRRRLVNEGQLVKAGEQIAEMGRSGAPRDMLHFEIRYNGKPVDPLLYLPPR